MMKTVLLVFNVAAAFNGLLLAGVLMFQERIGRAQIRLALAGLLGAISILLGVFVALDSGVVIYSMSLGVFTDALGLIAGALLFNYVCGISGYAMTPWPFAPVIIYLISVLAFGGRYLPPTDIAPIIITQALYSVAALAAYWRKSGKLPTALLQRRENQLLPALFAGIFLLHGAQFLRLAFPGNNFFFDLVPFIGALGLTVLVLYGVTGSQTLIGFGRHQTPAPTGSTAKAEQIEAAITANKAHLDPDISLQKAAAFTDMNARDLSAHINSETGQNFRDFINNLRIEEAKKLLASPSEAKTSVEAIGLLSGFRSRSSFYEAFKARCSMTPAEFRKKHLEFPQ